MSAVTTAFDPRISSVLAELHGRSRREMPSLISYFLLRSIPRWISGRGATAEVDDSAMSFLRDKLIALEPDKCELCYIVCRSLRAQRIVEVGTSFGVSTIYLAAAARENATGNTQPVVIGTELDEHKIAAARGNLQRAGLAAFADIRAGDARETLKEVEGPLDFVLLDSWIPLARPIIEMLAPRLRPGAVVICDYTARFSRQYRAYLDFVRTPGNGFRSIALPYRGGLEFSVRTPH